MAALSTELADSSQADDLRDDDEIQAPQPPDPALRDDAETGHIESIAEQNRHNCDDVDRYRILAELVPHLVWILDQDGFPVYLNQRCLDFIGCSMDDTCRFGWLDWVDEADRPAVIASFAAAFEAGVAYETVCRLRGAVGVSRWFIIRSVPIPNGKSGNRGWVGTCTDIHDEKRKEEIQHFMVDLDLAMRVAPTPDDALLEMVTRLGKYLQVSYCSYQENEFFEDYAIMTIRQDYHVSGLKSLVGRYHSDMISPAIKSLSAHGGTVVISDITTDQRTQNYTAYFEENKLIAILYVPIMRKGVEVADLAVVQTSPREWREDEVALVEAVADRMWLALDAARFYNESLQAAARQRGFVRDVLESVTDGHLRICDADADLPAPLPEVGERVDLLAEEGLRRIRHAVRDIAREANFDEGRVSDLMTAVGEAAMNSVVHAGNGVAWICTDIDTIQVWVSDTGRGIAVEKLPQATLVRGFSTAGTLGHGFKMILQSIDRVYLLTGETGTTVVLEQGRTLPERVF